MYATVTRGLQVYASVSAFYSRNSRHPCPISSEWHLWQVFRIR